MGGVHCDSISILAKSIQLTGMDRRTGNTSIKKISNKYKKKVANV